MFLIIIMLPAHHSLLRYWMRNACGKVILRCYRVFLLFYLWGKWWKPRSRSVRFYVEWANIQKHAFYARLKTEGIRIFGRSINAIRVRAMITIRRVILEMRRNGKRERESGTRLIISIFHSVAPDEKERQHPTTINGRFYSAISRRDLLLFFFCLVFPPPRGRSYLMVPPRARTAGTCCNVSREDLFIKVLDAALLRAASVR